MLDLVPPVVAILRADAGLKTLAPNWDAADAGAHVFPGPPPVGALNAGRAPCVVVAAEAVAQPARAEGDRPDAVTTVTLALRAVDRRAVGTLACRLADVLAAEGNRHLGDPAHVLGPAEPLGPCEAMTLRLHVRVLTEPGV